MIAEVTPFEVLRTARASLGLPPAAAPEAALDEAFMGASLRRLAGFLCPCSPVTLRATLCDGMRHLAPEGTDLRERVDAALEALIAGGDLLELSDVATADPDTKGTWVFAAPPTFVARSSGSIFLLGVAAEEVSPLPAVLNARIRFEAFARVIEPAPGEDLPAALRELGLRQISTEDWLRLPRAESADEHCRGMDAKLAVQQQSGEIADLRILDTAQPVGRYADRWVEAKGRSGRFVARRPQAYGADLWGYVEIAAGSAIRLLDFPPKGSRHRGCDVAWRLQMAIDYCRGAPQTYRPRAADDGVILDFFSPLPMWAQRRLSIISRPAARQRSLFSYWVPTREAAAEEDFLERQLWLARNK